MNSRPVSTSDTILIIAWFGVVMGWIDTFVLSTKRYVLHLPLDLGFHYVWMTPIADLILIGLIGISLLLIERIWPRLITTRVTVILLAFLCALHIKIILPGVHLLGVVVLAAGLAYQTSRMILARQERFLTFVRRSLPVALALIPLLAMVMLFIDRPRSPTSPPPDSPNVVLIVLDTVRASSMSLYGYERSTTPNLENWAKKGVVFDTPIAPSSWTLPSHASMFTGRFPHELSTGRKSSLDDTYLTIADVLKDKGYMTAGFVSNTIYCSYEFGIDRGFQYYEDYEINLPQFVVSSSLIRSPYERPQFRQALGIHEYVAGRKSAEDLNSNFFEWLDRQEGGQPFFVFLNFFDAHDPYLPPLEFAQKYSSTAPRGFLPLDEDLSKDEIQELNDAYDGAIAYLDHQINLLLEELDNRKQLQNTLVIITSDHGEHFGEHGLMGHQNSLFIDSIKVPLMMIYPGVVPEDQWVDSPISLYDLPETILDILGHEGAFDFPGNSLARYWQQNDIPSLAEDAAILSDLEHCPNTPDIYPCHLGVLKSILLGDMHYIKNLGSGSEELYNLTLDPFEQTNLATSPNSEALITKFRLLLESLMGDPDWGT